MNAARGSNDFGSAAGEPVSAATGAGVTSPAPASALLSLAASPPWQRERARTLHRICQWVEARAQRGAPVRRTVRRFARRWNGHPYRCAPARTLRLSPARLKNLFYEWRKQPSPAVFQLRYQPFAAPVTAALLATLVTACAAPGVTSYRAAWLTLKRRATVRGEVVPSYTTLWKCLPPRQRLAVRELHRRRLAARRGVRQLERALAVARTAPEPSLPRHRGMAKGAA